MSKLNGVAELLARIDECLDQNDWERLAGLEAPPASGSIDAPDEEIRETLGAVQAMQQKLQERLETVKAELDLVPAVRMAAKAYLSN